MFAKQAVVLSWLKEVHVCLFIFTVNLSDQLQVIKMDQNANWKEKIKEELWTGNAAAHRPGAIDGWSFQCVWVSTGDAAIHRPGGTEGWSLLWVWVSTVLAELFIWVWLSTEKMVQWLFGNCGWLLEKVDVGTSFKKANDEPNQWAIRNRQPKGHRCITFEWKSLHYYRFIQYNDDAFSAQ